MSDLYLSNPVRNLQYGLKGNLKLIKVFFAIGVFMLLLGCINYVNLTTARSVVRMKEMMIKKINGCSATLLRFQLIAESVLVALISMVVAMTLLQAFLPLFNVLAVAKINSAELNSAVVWIVSAAILLGILSGIYPALCLTGNPARLINKNTGKRFPWICKKVFNDVSVCHIRDHDHGNNRKPSSNAIRTRR